MKRLQLLSALIFLSYSLLAQIPVITSFSPANGAPGITVILSGSNFSTVA